MKKFGISGMGTTICGLLFYSSIALAKTADQYIEEAQLRYKEGDLASAAVLYQKALAVDQHNMMAKRALKDVLLEARRRDPHGEHTDAEWALLEDQRAASSAREILD